ncbi:MFS transporter [Burkholderia cepacia]|uniref:MFS transporter n=1 Tax=Burkholderia cepacia TaxID=292 RepID=UPI001574F8A2|nr:MFS transporter [Burkholderia cepacia]NTX21304.1 MFS transporter [Burkholderia cepacia]
MNADALNPGGSDKRVARNILIASIGNALEWFDFIAYGFLAATIAKVFFPTGNEFSSMLLATASFGVPFIVRPIGAVLIGRYGDRKGRKPALTATVAMMLVGTLIIAVTPSYQAIGLLAPVLVVVARVIQGFAAGGEFGSATAFLVEQNPSRRGFYGSWQFASQSVSATLAAGIVWILFTALPAEAITSWAWRIPFFLGLAIGPVGLLMRRSMHETDEFTAMQTTARDSEEQRSGTRGRVSAILICVGLVMGGTVASYVLGLYLPTFAIRRLHLPPTAAFASATAVGVVSLIVCPLAGALSDRFGRRRVMSIGLVSAALTIMPTFSALLSHPTLTTLIICQVAASFLLSFYTGPLAAAMAEIFSTRERTFGISVGYNISVTVFGGFAPAILTLLIHDTQSDMAPGWYALLAMIVSLASLAAVKKERSGRILSADG